VLTLTPAANGALTEVEHPAQAGEMNVGTRFAVFRSSMKKNSQILRQPKKLSLGDLIVAVSSCTKSSRETVAAVADLLGSGKVRVEDHGRTLRAKVC